MVAIRILALLLFASTAFAQTNETQYIDWATGCGGNDGTIGNPYCTCQEWEDQNRNLVSENVNLTVEFSGTGSGSASCTISGWTTDATRRIALNGLEILSTNYGAVVTVGVANVTFNDMSIGKNTAGTIITIFNSTAAIAVNRSTVYCGSSCTRDSGNYGAVFFEGSTIRNSIFYGLHRPVYTSFASVGAGIVTTYENNTIIGGVTDNLLFERESGSVDGTLILRNNISQDATSSDYVLPGGSVTLTSATNISSDATSPQAGLRNITLTFVDAAGDDYRLAVTDTDAIDAGTTIGSFSDDIDGTTRPSGSAWDIGAHEFIQAGGVNHFAVLEAIGAL